MTTPQCRTLRDLAALAKVSHVTVSLALRNHPRIPVATCRRIQALAEQHGYRVNPFVAVQMAAVRTHHPPAYQATLAVLTDRAARDGFERNESLVRYVAGARARAERLGYRIEVFRIGPGGLEGARLSQVLISRNIPGVMIPPLSFYDGPLDLDWTRFAAAAIGYYHVGKLPFHVAYYDTFHAVNNVARRLSELGYRRPGLALRDKDDVLNSHLWSASFRHVQAALAPRNRVPLLVTGEWSAKVVTSWYRKHQPDVILGIRDDVPTWLAEAGYSTPQDYGFADLVWMEKLREHAGFCQDLESIASAAIDMIVGQIHRNERGFGQSPHTLLVKGWWVPGRSLKDPSYCETSRRLPPAVWTKD
jgi:DNA-binding LacI/PurR family transcriptional regulator